MSLEINVYDKTGELFYTTKSLQDLEEHSFLFRPGDKAVIEGEIDGANIFHHKNEQPPKQQNKKDDNSIIRLNKIGKFSIQTDFIYDQPELVKEILKDLIIVKTERS
ncbi:MAG: hypothetical protein H6Q71_2740, partial [Firmicutes bacterium]|nr:hypothetical protein [Bacillota bacterium]